MKSKFFLLFLALLTIASCRKSSTSMPPPHKVVTTTQKCEETLGPQRYDSLFKELLVGNLPSIKKLLSEGGCDGDIVAEGKTTPLMIAAEQDHFEVAQELLRRGATVDRKDLSGCTALMFAAQACSPRLVKLLVDSGAYVPMKTYTGNTSQDLALIVAQSLEGDYYKTRAARELPCSAFGQRSGVDEASCMKVIQSLKTSGS